MKKLLSRFMMFMLVATLSGLLLSAQSIEDLKGKPAPTWSLKSPDGKTVKLTDFKGKIVVLDFWATWCGPCRAAMPSIQKLSKQYEKKDVVVIGVNAWEKDSQLAVDYMKAQKFDYRLVLGGDRVAADYRVEGIPTLVIINTQGIIADIHVGYDPELQKKLSIIIDKLLAAR